MANFKICIRKQRKDGFYPVYIRVQQVGVPKVAYIKTDKVTTAQYVGKGGEVTDPYVLDTLNTRILDFINRLNAASSSEYWTVQQIVEYITTQAEDICFSDYARKYIDAMIDEGRARTAQNYRAALKSLELFACTNRIMFDNLTTAFIGKWIESLSKHARCKEQFPICIRQVFKKAVREFNDYDNNIIRIKKNPWMKVEIPKGDTPDQRAIKAEDVRAFFACVPPDNGRKEPLAELGQDVAKIIFCLAGMNTVDIFDLRKEQVENGIIGYNRAKTCRSRRDAAYFEMRIPGILEPLIEKYKDTDEESEYFFNFHNRFSSSDSFCSNTNIGIKQICKAIGVPDHEWYCVYTWRHSWATIAQNDCGASIPEVGFALNHSHGQAVTRGYIKPNFAPAWELNDKVIDFVFFSDKPSAVVEQQQERKNFRISPKMLIKGQAYIGGKCKAAVVDDCFSTAQDVIDALVAELPDDIPDGARVQFKLTNHDNGEVATYEKQKGKGF